MPYRKHVRITAIGSLGFGAGVESFQYTLNVAPSNAGSEFLADNFTSSTEARALWTDMAQDIAGFHGRDDTQISSLATLREVKFAQIGTDGRYVADPFIVNVNDTPGAIVATTETPVMPQTALAVTLHTATRGPRGKGRFYIPMPHISLERETLLIPTFNINKVRSSVALLIDDLNNAPGLDTLDIDVHVVSSFGTSAKVTGVSVGRVMDTIRSRRRGIPEARTAILPVS